MKDGGNYRIDVEKAEDHTKYGNKCECESVIPGCSIFPIASGIC